MTMRIRTAAVLLLAALAGCGDITGGDDGAAVSIRFAGSAGAAALAPSPALLPGGGARDLTVTGSNGSLTLTTMRLVVAEFELKRDERIDECDASGRGNPCRRFEAPPFLLDVPLGGGPVELVRDNVPPGRYSELEFEIEDLEEDADDDPAIRQGIATIRSQIQAAFPGVQVPREVSMIVVGSFTPAGGQPRPFAALFDADVEVELHLEPPCDTAAGSCSITVDLDPARFFRRADGRVVDLSALDFLRTGRVFELEVEVRNGFRARVGG